MHKKRIAAENRNAHTHTHTHTHIQIQSEMVIDKNATVLDLKKQIQAYYKSTKLENIVIVKGYSTQTMNAQMVHRLKWPPGSMLAKGLTIFFVCVFFYFLFFSLHFFCKALH